MSDTNGVVKHEETSSNSKTSGLESSEDVLLPLIKKYVDRCETLSRVTLSEARSSVTEELGRDVDKKSFKTILISYLQQKQAEDDKKRKRSEEEVSDISDESEEEDSDEEDEVEDVRPSKKSRMARASPTKGKKQKGSFATIKNHLSPILAKFLGVKEETRPQVVKKMWEYIKEHELQEPSDKRQINCDKELKKIFKRDFVTMFSMNKFLSFHMISQKDWDSGERKFKLAALEEPDDKPTRTRTSRDSKKLARTTKRVRETPKRKTNSTGTKGGFAKPLRISEKLQEFMGTDTAARTEVIKKLWEHIRSFELQNPKNKREILCDDTLKRLLGQNKVTIFSMNKHIQPHFIKDDE